LFVAVIFAAVLCASLCAAKLTFSVHGDWGVPIDWADTLGHISEQKNSKFLLAIGDNFYGRLTYGYHGVKSVTDSKWKTIFEDIYTHKWFKKPWYVIAGNHDYEASIKAQIAYTKLSKRWKFKSKYYVVHEKDIDIFMIDTTPLSGNAAELKKEFGIKKYDMKQVAWLGAQLKKSKAKWKVVVGHHPIRLAQQGGNYQLQKHVEPLFKKYKVAAYIAGHMHNMQHVTFQGMHYITIGNGAIQVPVDHLAKEKGVKQRFIFPTEDQFKTICDPGDKCRGFGLFTVKSSKAMSVKYYDSTGYMRKEITVSNPRR